MNAIQQLRSATRPLHDRVDAAFGQFDLGDERSYIAFLLAHARALPSIERVLAALSSLPRFRPRTSLLAADLAALGEAMPTALPFALEDPAAGWGALYVAEGSRLGGIMLAAQVTPAFPSTYLSARHERGEWRTLLAATDAAATDEAWIGRAVSGARAAFSLYERAAAAADA